MGEGAVIYTVEELEHALARQAPLYGEVLAFASGNEGGYGTRIEAGELALADAILNALRSSDLAKQDIDHINAHGNSMPDYDLVETRAFKRAFGTQAYNIPICSVKSMIGHAMGAGSAFQVAAACLSLTHSRSTLIPEIPTVTSTMCRRSRGCRALEMFW
jgi:3-oxoacyl-(acyl-carrier-protein) synthase